MADIAGVLKWCEEQESYFLRRAQEEKDQFMRNYFYEKSRIYSEFHAKLRNAI